MDYINRLRWWLVRLLIGKRPAMFNVEIHGLLFERGTYMHGCRIVRR